MKKASELPEWTRNRGARKILDSIELSDEQKEMAQIESFNMTMAAWNKLCEKFGGQDKVNEICQRTIVRCVTMARTTEDVAGTFGSAFIFGMCYGAGLMDYDSLDQMVGAIHAEKRND